MNAVKRKQLMTDAFVERYEGQTPTGWVQAPGRVDLMGSHTDYNKGYVLTMSINRNTWIALRPRGDRQVRISSLNLEGVSSFELERISHDKSLPWTNYVRGVAKILQEEQYPLHGFDGLVHSTIPISSGLSSSAALEVATATAFETLGQWLLDPLQKALFTQRAENTFVGVNCGILDQYTSTKGQAGHAVLLDCRDLSSEPVAIPPSVRVVICDTQAKRELSGSEYAVRRAQCEEGVAILARYNPAVNALRDVSLSQLEAHHNELSAIVERRCRFIIEENARVKQLALSLPINDRRQISELTLASYLGARDLYEISCPEMDAMYQAMTGGPGVIGARQAGAGFGGCMVAFVDQDEVDGFSKYVKHAYSTLTTIQPIIYPVQAAPGAGPVSVPQIYY